MSNRSKLIALPLWGLLALGGLLVGCGSDGQIDQTALATAQAQNASNFILGRVRLDSPLNGGIVRVLDTQGNEIQTFVTDRRGWFWRRAVLPDDFTVVAYRGHETYRTEIRGGWKRGTLYINAGTTLASAYLRAHPGLTLDQVEAKIQEFYGLPPEFKMSWIGTMRTDHFDSAAFYRGVSQAGSVEAYTDRVVANIDQAIRPKESLAIQAATTLITTAAQGIFGQSVNTAVGDTIAHLNLNFTTASALTQIEGMLDDITTQLSALTDLEKTIALVTALKDQLDTLDKSVTAVNNDLSLISATSKQYRQVHGNELNTVLPTADSSLSGVVSTLGTLDVVNVTQPVVASITGSIQSQIMLATPTQSNLPDRTQFGGYPWRTNTDTATVYDFTARYGQCLYGAALLNYELAQLASDESYPVKLLQANNFNSQLFAVVQEGGQSIPDRIPSDDLIVDLPHKAMWYKEIMPAMTLLDAQAAADNLVVGPYGGGHYHFELPSSQRTDNLIRTRIGPQIDGLNVATSETWSNASTSQWTAAFQKMGFDTSNYTHFIRLPGGDSVGESSFDDNEGMFFQPDSDKHFFYTWNGDGSNPHREDDSLGFDNGTSSFLLCMDYPKVEYEADRPNTNDPDYFPYQDAAGTRSPFIASILQIKTSLPNNPPSLSVVGSNSLGTQLRATQKFVAEDDSPIKFWGQNHGDENFDVTNRVVWTSSNESIATVSNLPARTYSPYTSHTDVSSPPGPAGFVTWHPPVDPSKSVQISATIYGNEYYDGTPVRFTGNLNLTAPNAQLNLKQVYFQPQNRRFNISNLPKLTIPFFLTAYYADGQIKDISTDPSVSWTVKGPDGTIYNSSTTAGFGVLPGSKPNELTVFNTIPSTATTLTIRAEYQNKSFSGNIGLLLPTP